MAKKEKVNLRQFGISTTVRNSERVPGFLAVLKKYFEGKQWDQENQEKYQIRLIQNKLYKPIGMLDSQKHYFEDEGESMTIEQANEIWEYQRDVQKKVSYANDKGYFGLRGRTSASPLTKLGFWYKEEDDKVKITELGEKVLSREITIDDAFVFGLLKYQIPTSKEDDYYKKGYSIKPLVATLHLIKKVNELWEERKEKSKGVSRPEFNLFIGTLIKKSDIETHAKILIQFREKLKKEKSIPEKRKLELQTILVLNYQLDQKEREKIWTDFLEWDEKRKKREKGVSFTEFWKENKNDLYQNWLTLNDYGDNMRRYYLMSEWVSVRGGLHIDLNQWRRVEIEALLKFDDGNAEEFDDDEEYGRYVSNTTKPTWPWKTKEKLSEIYLELQENIETIKPKVPSTPKLSYLTIDELKELEPHVIETKIEEIKPTLLELNTKVQITELESSEKILEVINSLEMDFLKHDSLRKAPVELEYQTTRGLMALDDGDIKPNYPKGIDGQPTSHAGGGIPDIECFYEKFNMVCEVTLLNSQDQWKAEGTSVPEHFEQFIKKHKKEKNFCLFIAPKLHERTVRTFYQNNLWPEEKFGRTIPITITQFQRILKTLENLKIKNKGITHDEMLVLYQEIIDSIGSFPDGQFVEWAENISSVLDKWIQEIIA